jgi:hypothetical protein
MKKLFEKLYKIYKAQLLVLIKLGGIHPLNKQQTFEKLQKNTLLLLPGETVTLKPATTWGNYPPDFKKDLTVKNQQIGVFKISGDVKFFNYGGVQYGKNLLELDFSSSQFIKTLIKKDKRPVIHTTYCIPLWSHYWGTGYYDYVFYVYTKLLRIKTQLDPARLREVKIAYPLFYTPFEKELLELAGFREDQIIDSVKFNIQADEYYLANTQSWYYPQKHDIKLVQQLINEADSTENSQHEYIYISRKGRRKLLNEPEITALLKAYNFTFIEDKPRPVKEQMAIFNNAKIIIGPHGAAFTNIIWCKPHTLLIELFPNSYHPPYFRYLAQILDLRYACLFENDIKPTHFTHLDDNLTIDPLILKKALDEVTSS